MLQIGPHILLKIFPTISGQVEISYSVKIGHNLVPPKPNKNPFLLKSYRPISLTSVLYISRGKNYPRNVTL